MTRDEAAQVEAGGTQDDDGKGWHTARLAHNNTPAKYEMHMWRVAFARTRLGAKPGRSPASRP